MRKLAIVGLILALVALSLVTTAVAEGLPGRVMVCGLLPGSAPHMMELTLVLNSGVMMLPNQACSGESH